MPRYRTLNADEGANAVARIKDFEPLVIDGKLMAIIAGPLRIYANKDVLVVSEKEPE